MKLLSRLNLLWLSASLLSLPAVAESKEAEIGGHLFRYSTTSSGTITIEPASGAYADGAVTIPSKIDGLPVTSIASAAFNYCDGAGGITSLKIPNTVTNIDDFSCYRCYLLTSVSIPNSVTHIGMCPFSECSRLQNISVAEGNPTYSSVDGVLFNNDQTTLIQFPCGRTGKYSPPATVTNIGYCAFINCACLTNITILSNVKHIDAFAFGSCTNLSVVCFKGNAPSLGKDVFGGTTNATIYYLPGTTGWSNSFGGRPTAVWTNAIPAATSK